MVKGKSCRASNRAFQVQILVEALCPWCSRLARDAVTVEVAGSNPPDTLFVLRASVLVLRQKKNEEPRTNPTLEPCRSPTPASLCAGSCCATEARSCCAGLAEALVDTHRRSNDKTARNYPRKKKEKPPGPPKLKTPGQRESNAQDDLSRPAPCQGGRRRLAPMSCA